MNERTNADVGDYMKTFACTAVILQSVLSLVLSTGLTHSQQMGVGIAYDFVKFTAPAFIFGILFSTIRSNPDSTLKNYPNYMRNQWRALFVPTIWWTLAYLLIFPNVQQVTKFNDVGTFLWQFINGNAAPHLWYNTMMLQFIILMPVFWVLANYVNNSKVHAWGALIISLVLFFTWIVFYETQVFHGPHMTDWYLLDRIFVSFFIYGVLGVLTWKFHKTAEKFLKKTWFLFVIAYILIVIWTNKELFSFGFPVLLTNAPYYKISMTLYCLAVIALIASLAFKNIRDDSPVLIVFHFLATYAYRAYLSNVFWLQVIWHLFGESMAKAAHPALSIVVIYLLTWCLSFLSAVLFHTIWSKVKNLIVKPKTAAN